MKDFISKLNQHLGDHTQKEWLLTLGALLMAGATIALALGVDLLYPARILLRQRVPTPIEEINILSYHPSPTFDVGATNIPQIDYGPYPTTEEEFMNARYQFIDIPLPQSDNGQMIHLQDIAFVKGATSTTLYRTTEQNLTNIVNVRTGNNIQYAPVAAPLTLRIVDIATTTTAWGDSVSTTHWVGILLEVTYEQQTYRLLMHDLHESHPGEPERSIQLTNTPLPGAREFTHLAPFGESAFVATADAGTSIPYALETVRHGGYSITLLSLDGISKHYRPYDGSDIPVTFWYPKVYSTVGYYGGGYYSSRSVEVEVAQDVTPVYFDGTCGLEPQLSEYSVMLSPRYIREELRGHAPQVISIGSRLLTNTPVYITTPHFGYDPTAWNTVQSKIDLYDYAAGVASGRSLPDKKTEQVTIEGITMRHTFPFVRGRPCDTQYREQYQWVKSQHIFTVDIVYQQDQQPPFDTEATRALITTLARTMQIVGK